MSMPSEGVLRRLHPLTLLLRFAKSIPALAIAILSSTAAVPDGQQRFQNFIMLGLSAAYAFVAVPLIIAHFLKFSYRITPREIIIRSGVFRRRKRNIPLERIQNVAIERSLLPRLAGLSSVKIMTAGSAEAEGVLEYTSQSVALDIRDLVRKGSQVIQPDVAFSDTEPATGQLLVDMPLRRVFLAGAFRFSLVYIAIIFSAVAYAQQFNSTVEQAVMDWLLSNGGTNLVMDVPKMWGIAVFAVVLAIVLAWISGIVATVVRFYRYRLRRMEDKLVRSHGLLTLQEATIPLKRIQALIVRSNPLMRAFGWFRIELQTIGYDVSRRGGNMAIPLARLDEIAQVGPRIRPFELPESYEHVSPLAIRRTFLRYVRALIVVLLPLGLWLGSAALWGLSTLPLLGVMAWLQYRNHGYVVGADTVYIRHGVFKQKIWVVPFERLQTFRVNGTWFQRRLGLCTVTPDTAGAGVLRYPRVVDLPTKAADTLLEALYAGLRASIAGSGT